MPSSIQQLPTAAKIEIQDRKNNQTRIKNKKETHLTTTGVCTTICPENSGM
jgi:hypothetical protein